MRRVVSGINDGTHKGQTLALVRIDPLTTNGLDHRHETLSVLTGFRERGFHRGMSGLVPPRKAPSIIDVPRVAALRLLRATDDELVRAAIIGGWELCERNWVVFATWLGVSESTARRLVRDDAVLCERCRGVPGRPRTTKQEG